MAAHPSRRIIHLDMDAFYASVETLDNPELLGKPVVVGGCSDRGVVSAASYEARGYGIHSALPIAMAKKLCPHAVFLPVRMERYQEISQRIMAIFARFTPLVEPLSLDEAFLDVTASRALMGPAEEIAREIKRLVRERTGLTVSAGVASSKLVAKIASDLNKPDGLTIVPAGAEKEFLAPLPIGRLWGVGRVTREILSLLGVKTIGDLHKLPPRVLTGRFGKAGLFLLDSARGIDSRPVEPEREAKSIGNEETFATDLRDRKRIEQELLALCTKVGRRARRHGVRGKTVTLKVKYHDFTQITRAFTLAAPIDDDHTLYATGRTLLARTEVGSRAIRLLGISLSGFADKGTTQLFLFQDPEEKEKCQELYRAIDAISARYGDNAILPGKLLAEDPA
ncbi:DNA polymerase IV [Thiovibrio sp. JS02]